MEASDGARIVDNWIYDNADRGVQLFPDAQEHLHRAQRDRRQRAGDHLLARVREQRRREQRDLQPGAALQHRGLGADRRRQRGAPELRLEHAARGPRRHPAGPRRWPSVENKVIEPRFVDRGAKDFRLRADSPCLDSAPNLQPAATKAPAKRGLAVRLRSATAFVWPGGQRAPAGQGRVHERTRIGLEAGDPEGEAGRQVAPRGHDAPARRPLPVPAAARPGAAAPCAGSAACA